MACRFDLHPDRARVDAMMQRDVGPTSIERWLLIRKGLPGTKPISMHTLQTHRRVCLQLPPLPTSHSAYADVQKEIELAAGSGSPTSNEAPKQEALAAPPPPAGPRRSEKFGSRVITQDDLEQELMRKFLDDLDRVPPDKIADLMIEREKAKQRSPVVKGKGGEPPDEGDPIARLRRSIGAAAGARPTRTGVRMRAVKGGRAG